MGPWVLMLIVLVPGIGFLVSGTKLELVAPDMHEERRKWRRLKRVFGVLTACALILVVGFVVLLYYALSHWD